MTMQTERSSSSSSSSSQQQVDTQLLGFDAQSIKSIETATGWRNVENCDFVQFGIGKAHSPMTLNKVVPALRYRDPQHGKEVVTPLGQILSYSQDNVSGLQSGRGISS
jgi:hypothetical protein